ncbi:hypothetical protein [Bacillus cereus]
MKGLEAAITLISNKGVSIPVAQVFFVNVQGGGKVMEDYYHVMRE